MIQPTHYVIVNPAAGRGRGALAAATVQQMLGASGIRFALAETQGQGHAIELARSAAQRGIGAIVAVGGDGTAHEIVQGLVQAAQQRGDWEHGAPIGALGMIPVGTGNDLAWPLGMPENDPEAACRVLAENHRRLIDLGQITDETGRTEYFHNHLGGGFEAATAIESRKIQRLRGLLLYIVAVLRVIPKYTTAPKVTIQYNGASISGPMLLASAANGGRSGGGFKMAPEAQPDDGHLDLVLADSPNPAVTLWLLPHFLRGTHVSQRRFVRIHRTPDFTLEAPGGLPVHLDGEIFRADARRIAVRLLPKRLQVIARKP
jgi:YegS/Rv2252/BmrU family lipid kinase